MGSSWSLAVLAGARADEQECVDAELVEHVELLEAQMRIGGKTLPAMRAAGMILSPRTVRLLQEEEAAPIAWGRLALLGGLVLAPWAVFGSLVYIGLPLAS